MAGYHSPGSLDPGTDPPLEPDIIWNQDIPLGMDVEIETTHDTPPSVRPKERKRIRANEEPTESASTPNLADVNFAETSRFPRTQLESVLPVILRGSSLPSADQEKIHDALCWIVGDI